MNNTDLAREITIDNYKKLREEMKTAGINVDEIDFVTDGAITRDSLLAKIAYKYYRAETELKDRLAIVPDENEEKESIRFLGAGRMMALLDIASDLGFSEKEIDDRIQSFYLFHKDEKALDPIVCSFLTRIEHEAS